LKALKLRQGQTVADIGAGGGYFSLRFAEILGGNGRVFAVDTNQRFLEYIRNEAKKKGLENVETILVDGGKLDLPEKGLDLVLCEMYATIYGTEWSISED